MGNCALNSGESDPNGILHRSAYKFNYVIGKGGFGRVWKVEHKKTRRIYAMKEMEKSRILAKKSVNSVMNERKILSMAKHPFLVNM
jgi:serine/threonine protein kinase